MILNVENVNNMMILLGMFIGMILGVYLGIRHEKEQAWKDRVKEINFSDLKEHPENYLSFGWLKEQINKIEGKDDQPVLVVTRKKRDGLDDDHFSLRGVGTGSRGYVFIDAVDIFDQSQRVIIEK